MAQGRVTTNNLNLAQGNFREIERRALFIGIGSKNMGSLLSLNSQSDLSDLLGVNDSEIKRNVVAAKLNGGENWQAWAAPQSSGYTWTEVVESAMATASPELVILCTPAIDGAELDAMQAQAEILRTQFARRVIILTATPGIDPTADTGQTWSDYEAAQAAITTGISAYRVGVQPQLHGNDLGVLAGRLCNRAVSIADSPMRVATGPVLGLGPTPVDKDGVELTGATLTTLDANRLSCIQRYPDYPGTYYSDGNLLDVPAGDYQVIENLRVVDKLARRIRILQINRIANRQLNSTPTSIAANKLYFGRPLREMSKSTIFSGEHFPAEIKPPKEGDIEIVWITNNKVQVFFKATPYNSPKEIEANIILDLTTNSEV